MEELHKVGSAQAMGFLLFKVGGWANSNGFHSGPFSVTTFRGHQTGNVIRWLRLEDSTSESADLLQNDYIAYLYTVKNIALYQVDLTIQHRSNVKRKYCFDSKG